MQATPIDTLKDKLYGLREKLVTVQAATGTLADRLFELKNRLRVLAGLPAEQRPQRQTPQPPPPAAGAAVATITPPVAATVTPLTPAERIQQLQQHYGNTGDKWLLLTMPVQDALLAISSLPALYKMQENLRTITEDLTLLQTEKQQFLDSKQKISNAIEAIKTSPPPSSEPFDQIPFMELAIPQWGTDYENIGDMVHFWATEIDYKLERFIVACKTLSGLANTLNQAEKEKKTAYDHHESQRAQYKINEANQEIIKNRKDYAASNFITTLRALQDFLKQPDQFTTSTGIDCKEFFLEALKDQCLKLEKNLLNFYQEHIQFPDGTETQLDYSEIGQAPLPSNVGKYAHDTFEKRKVLLEQAVTTTVNSINIDEREFYSNCLLYMLVLTREDINHRNQLAADFPNNPELSNLKLGAANNNYWIGAYNTILARMQDTKKSQEDLTNQVAIFLDNRKPFYVNKQNQKIDDFKRNPATGYVENTGKPKKFGRNNLSKANHLIKYIINNDIERSEKVIQDLTNLYKASTQDEQLLTRFIVLYYLLNNDCLDQKILNDALTNILWHIGDTTLSFSLTYLIGYQKFDTIINPLDGEDCGYFEVLSKCCLYQLMRNIVNGTHSDAVLAEFEKICTTYALENVASAKANGFPKACYSIKGEVVQRLMLGVIATRRLLNEIDQQLSQEYAANAAAHYWFSWTQSRLAEKTLDMQKIEAAIVKCLKEQQEYLKKEQEALFKRARGVLTEEEENIRRQLEQEQETLRQALESEQQRIRLAQEQKELEERIAYEKAKLEKQIAAAAQAAERQRLQEERDRLERERQQQAAHLAQQKTFIDQEFEAHRSLLASEEAERQALLQASQTSLQAAQAKEQARRAAEEQKLQQALQQAQEEARKQAGQAAQKEQEQQKRRRQQQAARSAGEVIEAQKPVIAKKRNTALLGKLGQMAGLDEQKNNMILKTEETFNEPIAYLKGLVESINLKDQAETENNHLILLYANAILLKALQSPQTIDWFFQPGAGGSNLVALIDILFSLENFDEATFEAAKQTYQTTEHSQWTQERCTREKVLGIIKTRWTKPLFILNTINLASLLFEFIFTQHENVEKSIHDLLQLLSSNPLVTKRTLLNYTKKVFMNNIKNGLYDLILPTIQGICTSFTIPESVELQQIITARRAVLEAQTQPPQATT